MSYILDALKKSEQERGQGNIPNVQTVHSSSLNYGNKKNTYWHYILITAVLLNLLAISYFIFDKEKSMATKIETNIQHTSELTPESSPAIATSKETSRLNDNESFKQNTTQLNSSSKKDISTNIATNRDTEKKPVIKPAQKHSPKILNSSTSHRAITDYYDLPDTTKNRLPAIGVSAHVFSTNPLQRSIVINNNFMEEGEYLSNKLFLHEITQDGVIFDFDGDLINYSVVSKWQ